MLAKRLPLLSAFLGGCLCTAALVGFRDADRKPSAPTASTQHASLFVSALEASAESDADIQAEPPPSRAEDADEPNQEVGSSLADVLSRLERAYKALSPGPATDETSAVPVAAPAAPIPAPVPEAAVVVATPVAAVTAAPPATADAVAQAVPRAPPENTAVEAPSAAPPETPPVESRPVTYVSELHQDIHVGDVHHGDRYQVEQLAVLQYLQLLALSSYAGGLNVPSARAVSPRRVTAPARAPRVPGPITVIPNPDNPWGFKFPPPALVK